MFFKTGISNYNMATLSKKSYSEKARRNSVLFIFLITNALNFLLDVATGVFIITSLKQLVYSGTNKCYFVMNSVKIFDDK